MERCPRVLQTVGVLGQYGGQSAVSKHFVNFAPQLVRCSRSLERGTNPKRPDQIRKVLNSQRDRGALRGFFTEIIEGCATLQKTRGHSTFADLFDDLPAFGNCYRYSFGERLAHETEMNRNLENCDAPRKPFVWGERVGPEQNDVTRVQPRLGEVQKFPAIGEVNHQRPKIYQPPSERLLGTGARFDPVQPQTGAFRRFAHGFDGHASRSIGCADLDGRNVLEADAQNALRNMGGPGSEIPDPQGSRSSYRNKDRS